MPALRLLNCMHDRSDAVSAAAASAARPDAAMVRILPLHIPTPLTCIQRAWKEAGAAGAAGRVETFARLIEAGACQ
jgi:hypothetical protein